MPRQNTAPRVAQAPTLLLTFVLALSTALSARAQGTIGPLLPSDLLVSTGAATLGDPAAVAFDGSRYLVVWAQRTDATRLSDIYGRFVNSGGAAAGPAFFVFSGTFHQTQPAVAFTGSHYLVAWADGPSPNAIRARAVSMTGTVHATVTLVTGNVSQPSVASDGTGAARVCAPTALSSILSALTCS